MIPYLPKPNRGPAVREGFFRKDEFHTFPIKTSISVPGGATLHPKYHGKLRDLARVDYANRAACMGCSLRPALHDQLPPNPACRGRRRTRPLGGAPEGQARRARQRRMSVEHPFGSIKQWMNQGAFLMRRLPNVQGEFSLTRSPTTSGGR